MLFDWLTSTAWRCTAKSELWEMLSLGGNFLCCLTCYMGQWYNLLVPTTSDYQTCVTSMKIVKFGQLWNFCSKMVPPPPLPSEKKKIYKFMALHSGMEVFLKFRLILMCSEIFELQSHTYQYLNLLNLLW